MNTTGHVNQSTFSVFLLILIKKVQKKKRSIVDDEPANISFPWSSTKKYTRRPRNDLFYTKSHREKISSALQIPP